MLGNSLWSVFNSLRIVSQISHNTDITTNLKLRINENVKPGDKFVL